VTPTRTRSPPQGGPEKQAVPFVEAVNCPEANDRLVADQKPAPTRGPASAAIDHHEHHDEDGGRDQPRQNHFRFERIRAT